MKKIIGIIFLLTFSLSACSSKIASSGRFLQFTNPMNDTVAGQFTYPNERSCRFFLNSLSADKNHDLMKCSDISASALLSYRAAIRDTAFNYTMEIETMTYFMCATSVEGAIKDSRGEVEIMTPCETKMK
jgi:hypothetical protein